MSRAPRANFHSGDRAIGDLARRRLVPAIVKLGRDGLIDNATDKGEPEGLVGAGALIAREGRSWGAVA